MERPRLRPGFARLNVEPLEDRRVLSVTAMVNAAGDLVITGAGNDVDTVDVSLNDSGQIVVVYNEGMGTATKTFNVDIEGDPDAMTLTSGNISIDLGTKADVLTLSLLQNDEASLNITVTDGDNNDNDQIILRSNDGDGEFAPTLDLTSDIIRLGGASGSQYDTSGLTLDGAVRLEGAVTITTNDGDFDASAATISPGIVSGTPVATASLTIETGKGDALIGAMSATSDVLLQQLSITGGGDVEFVAGTGATTVESLTVDAGTITVNHDIDVTDGDTTLESTGVITFGDVSVDAHGNDLTFITGVTGADPFVIDAGATFEGGTVTIRPLSDATPIEIGAPAMPDPMALRLDPMDLQGLAGFSAIEIGSAQQSGTIGVFGALTLMSDPDVDLHLHAGMGDILVNAVVNVDGSVTVTGDGNTTTINADMMGASLTFNDDVRIGNDGDGITLTAAAGGVTFNNTVDSVAGETNPLTVSTMAGNVTFNGAVGASEPLAALIVNSGGVTRFASTVTAGSLTTNAGGSTQLNGAVTTSGAQSYGDAVRIDLNNLTLTTADSPVTFSSTVNSQASEANALTVSSGSGNVTFTGAVGATVPLGTLTVDSTGVTRFNSTVQAANLSTNMGGSTQLNGNVTTSGAQSYGDAVRIDLDNLTLTTTGNAVTFSSTVDGQPGETNKLTVTTGTGDITFGGAVGASVPLGALIANSTGVTRFSSTVQAASLMTNPGGSTQLNGDVTTSGEQSYGDDVRIDAGITLMTSNNDVTFSGAVDSQSGESNKLTVVTGSGNITFSGAVGASVALGALIAKSSGVTRFDDTVQAASLATEMGGSTQLNGDVTTTGPQSYGDNVRIDDDIVLTTTNSDVQFSGTVNSQDAEANDLTITAGTGNITFSAAVGGAMGGELGAVTINSAGDVSTASTFEAGSLVQAAGTGTTTIGGAMTLSAAAGLDLSTAVIVINDLVDTRTVGGTGAVRLAASDDVTLNAEIRSGTGTVDVLAGDDVTFAAAGLIDSTSGVITVRADANGDANGAGGSVFMNDGARIAAGSGRIVISADEDITLGGLQTTSTASNAVQLTSTSGGIVDGGDTHRDVVAAGGTLVIDAVMGVGSLNAIETTVAALDVANTLSGDIQIAELDAVSVVQLSQAGLGNIVLTTGNGSITVAAAGTGVSAGTGTVALTAGGATSNIVLQQDVTTLAAGGVSLSAGQDILDDGSAATVITTGNLTLSARRNIGDITSFSAGTGTPIDVSLSGQLLLAEITDAGGEIFIRADGNLTAGPSAINPDGDGAATALIVATGNLDVGTLGGVIVTAGDNLGLLAGGTLTVPAAGINVGTGDLRLRGDVSVQDGDLSLGTFTADSLEFVSGSALATTLSTAVATLTAEMTSSGAALTVLEQDQVLLESVVTNNGDLVVVLVSPGNILVGEVDSGTGLTALVAAPLVFFGGDGAILDADAAGADDVDVTGGQIVLLATQGIGATGNALDVDAGILAATTIAGDINIADVGDGLTVGTVAGFVGVQITGGALGDDITIAAAGAGGNLTVDAAVVTVGSGAVSLAAANDVSFTAAGQITTVTGNVTVDADGDIAMGAGSQINSTAGGSVELLAGGDIVIAQVTTTTGNVLADANGNVTMGAGSQINTTSGIVDVLAEGNVVITQITTIAGNVHVDANGGIMMPDGSQIVSTTGVIDLAANLDITVGRVQTSTDVILTAGGAIVDGGDTGGADITANQVALSAASGIGMGNAIETQVNILSAANSSFGDIAITNASLLASTLLTIGDVGGLTGVANTAAGGAVEITNFGSIDVNSTVTSAGDVLLTAENAFITIVIPTVPPITVQVPVPGNLTVNGQIMASGAIELDAGTNLVLNDTGAASDVQGASVIGRAGGVVIFAPDVIVRSATGAVADKLPFVRAVETNIDNLPLVTATVTLGRTGEENLIVTVDFDGQDLQTESFDIGAMAPITEVFESLVIAQLAQITITVTIIDDPNITFFEGGAEVVRPPDVFISGPVFNTGLITSLPRAEPLPLPLLEPEGPSSAATDVTPLLQENTFDELQAPPDAPESGDVRIIIVEKIGPDGEVELDRLDHEIRKEFIDQEAEEILEDPSKLFEKLKSGRFRIWLKDGADAERNLLWDVILRDGKPEAGGEGTQRLPTEVPAEAVPEATPQGTADPAAEAAVPEGGEQADPAAALPDGANEAVGEAAPSANAASPLVEESAGAASAAAAGALVLPAALKTMVRRSRGMARAVRSGFSALLRNIAP